MRGRAARAAVGIGSASAVALTAHTAYNLQHLRCPSAQPPTCREAVSVLLPVRDEAERVEACMRSLLAQAEVPDLQILVLDDGSTDGTAEAVKAVAADDPRVRVFTGVEPPGGWLGKPWACHQLATQARGDVLVFVDADVVLEPHAVAATVSLMRGVGLALVSPYPRQLADSLGERLVQPLLQWSWATTLPLGLAESSTRESLTAANGQLLAVDRAMYAAAGGHAAVRGEVLDDLALLRAVKRLGGRGGVVDGTHLATCRMYDGWAELRAGYTKSLWSAFGSPVGAALVVGGLGLVYVVPAVAALRGSRAGLLGYAAGVAGRMLVAHRVNGRILPDSLAHPLSVALLGGLVVDSWLGRRRGSLSWKGRAV
ncbi:MAG: glycosyltransferase family 2 protein [Candidatus Nanopelagicales bacterium]